MPQKNTQDVEQGPDPIETMLSGKPEEVEITKSFRPLLRAHFQKLQALEARANATREAMEMTVIAAFVESGLPESDLVFYNLTDPDEGFVLRSKQEVARLVAQGVIEP